MLIQIQDLQANLEEIVIGQETVIREVIVGLLAGGHVLLQGVPGIGKTRLARALTHLIEGEYSRIQFTPDLMPSDIVGNAYFDLQNGGFHVKEGPIFANVVLADEINRTPPKTQAALLEAMEERQVSIYGETRQLPQPFFVLATQNPIEYEGTYALPEAQLDRFLMQITVGYPAPEAEVEILRKHHSALGFELPRLSPVISPLEFLQAQREVQNVVVSEGVYAYIVALVQATRRTDGILLGASPRAATALLDAARAAAYLADRNYVIPDDVLEVVHPVLRHRLVLNSNAELEGVNTDEVVDRVVETVEVPR